ncbi:uncharacterized protein LOC128242336 [Mya arenaria]|uniref:uncharacterized protein LOC128242336 n=1 Tax=Mya arenaria TaxID=6604 RepID=UPI0022E4D235|nr:uncharacterized protein LOC128242336 [Mya arenaria]
MTTGRLILRVLVTLTLLFKGSRSDNPCVDLDPNGCKANPHLCQDPLLAEVTCPVTCRTGCSINPTSASISTTTTPTPIHPTSEVVGGHLTGQIPVGSNLIIFNDSDAWNHGRITGIRMLCGQYLLAMAIQYNGVWAQRHGFWAGNCATNQTWTPIHFFEEDEWIQHAELTGSWFTSSVTFTTNKRRLETCGIPEAVKFREGGRLEFVSGKFGCFFDRLQLHWSSYVSL